MTREQERDRYIEAILGGRLQYHLHRVRGAGFAFAWQYPYWRAVHRRWMDLWTNA